MKKLLPITVILFLGIILIGSAQVSFQGNSPQIVRLGEKFCVNYVLSTNGEQGKNIRLLETDGLKILSGPSILGENFSTVNINGKVSTKYQITYTYFLVAKREGEWTIPSATIEVGNSKYKSDKLKIKVLYYGQTNTTIPSSKSQRSFTRIQSQLSQEDVFVQTQVSKSSVYEHEGFLVTFELYSLMEFEIDNKIKLPDFEGFFVQRIDLPNKQVLLKNFRGHNYQTVILDQVVLYPQHAGKMFIREGKYDVIVRAKTNQLKRMCNSFFDDFFDTDLDVKKTLISRPIAIYVKSLPLKHPALFSGAVGEYRINSSISTTKLKVNDPITIKISLSGKGNIKTIKNPTIVFPCNFESYNPKVEVFTEITPQGINGTKNIEYYAVPRCVGDFIIPSIQFVYFDPKIKSYKTLFSKEYHLHVEPEGNNKCPILKTTNYSINKGKNHFIKKNIHCISTNGYSLQRRNFFYDNWKYWLSYLFPIVLFLILWIRYYKKIQENINLVKVKKPRKIAINKLELAQFYLKNNQKAAFYEEILKAVWGYLSDKLTISTSNLTKDRVELELICHGVQEELIKKVIFILRTAEFARYGPYQNDEIMGELYQQTVDIIQKMDKYNFSKK